MTVAMLPIPLPGTLGNDVGPGSVGVLVGNLTATALDDFLLSTKATASVKCVLEDGDAFTNKHTEINEATADDVAVFPAVPANDDAIYFGHDTLQFEGVDFNITTKQVGANFTYVWEYPTTAGVWTALSGVTDGSTGFKVDATGWKSLTFTVPGDWGKNFVNGQYHYWIRCRIVAYTALTTQPLLGQAYVIAQAANVTWTDDTTDANDADAGDVALLPAYPKVNDAAYFGLDEPFCILKVTTSQERTGTATLTWEYMQTGGTWAAVTTLVDDSSGWSATAGALLIHFLPPADWVACTAENGPNGQTGYFLRCRLSAMTDVTQQPLATQAWVYPMVTGARGIRVPIAGTIDRLDLNARTASGSTADSLLLVINTTTGVYDLATWTKATASDDDDTVSVVFAADDRLAIVQLQEDGTTEYANAFALAKLTLP